MFLCSINGTHSTLFIPSRQFYIFYLIFISLGILYHSCYFDFDLNFIAVDIEIVKLVKHKPAAELYQQRVYISILIASNQRHSLTVDGVF